MLTWPNGKLSKRSRISTESDSAARCRGVTSFCEGETTTAAFQILSESIGCRTELLSRAASISDNRGIGSGGKEKLQAIQAPFLHSTKECSLVGHAVSIIQADLELLKRQEEAKDVHMTQPSSNLKHSIAQL
eukprot:m.812341 g.812341  ORF g.812341 m.812341 type:complete len:132 (-) comp59341_c0_seq4:983-1378(-)